MRNIIASVMVGIIVTFVLYSIGNTDANISVSKSHVDTTKTIFKKYPCKQDLLIDIRKFLTEANTAYLERHIRNYLTITIYQQDFTLTGTESRKVACDLLYDFFSRFPEGTDAIVYLQCDDKNGDVYTIAIDNNTVSMHTNNFCIIDSIEFR